MKRTQYVYSASLGYCSLFVWLLRVCGIGGYAVFLSPAYGDVVTTPVYSFHSTNLKSLEFSPDGRYLLILKESRIYVYNVETKQLFLQKASAHSHYIDHASFAPHQRFIVAAGFGETRIYDLVDGNYFWMNRDSVIGKFTPDGKRLFLGGITSGYLSIFDTYTWKEITSLPVTNFSPFSIEFSPDQTKFAIFANHPNFSTSGSMTVSDLRLFALQTYDILHTIKNADPHAIETAVFDREGRYLISGGSYGFIKFWDAETTELIRQFTLKTTIYDLAVSSDNKYLVVGDVDKTVYLLDFETGREIRSFKYSKTLIGIRVDISSDSKYVVSGGIQGKSVDLWDISDLTAPSETSTETPTGTPAATPTPSRTPVPTPTNTPTMQAAHARYTLGNPGDSVDPGIIIDSIFLPDGKRILTLDYKKRIILWDKETKEILRILQTDIEFPVRMQITQDGHHVWTGGPYKDKFKLWGFDVETGDVIYEKLWNKLYSDWDLVSDESSILLGSGSQGLLLCDIQSNGILRTFSSSDAYPYVYCLSVSPQRDRVFVGEWEGCEFTINTRATIWDLQTGEALQIFTYNKRQVKNVFWSQDGRYVYTYSWSNQQDEDYLVYYLDQFDVESGAHLNRIVVRGADVSVSPDGSMVLMSNTSQSNIRPKWYTVDLVNYYTGEILRMFEHSRSVTSMTFSSDGTQILTGTNNSSSETASAFLWSIDDIPPITVPTLIPYTPTPTHTLTPTHTITPTPTPDAPRQLADNFSLEKTLDDVDLFAFHPLTGDLVYCRQNIDSQYRYSLEFSTLPPATFSIDMSQYPSDIWSDPTYRLSSTFRDMTISPNGKIYFIGSQLFEFSPENTTNPIRKWDIAGYALHTVSASDRIPNAKVGDILILRTPLNDKEYKTEGDLGTVLSELVIFDPETGSLSETPLVSYKQFPRGIKIMDMAIGPQNTLFFISQKFAKIFFLDQEGTLQEYFHFIVPSEPNSFCYLASDQSFLINTQSYLWRLSTVDFSIQPITAFTSDSKNKVSPLDGQTIALTHLRRTDNTRILYTLHIENPSGTPAPTPKSETPTAMPTAIPAWFVLDGFGGIHSSNDTVKPPVLPYFYDFNIVRDIEPDPQGKGWYMLDGFGGIHRSSPDLPISNQLPYFGFDIARNLEITADEEGYNFYVLDGYGAVHTTDPDFNFGYLPWVGQDIIRDLEPDPSGEGWLVMDNQGFLYSNEKRWMDSIRFAQDYAITPIMRGLVRFSDDHTVMIDFWGGRHTNPYYPALDRGNSFSPDFYFPGWEIIWDIEIVPIHSESPTPNP